nr:MAG TPA: hypothetical protein [Caudoviricetes sp.]
MRNDCGMLMVTLTLKSILSKDSNIQSELTQ